jgi:hypothetical protein
LAASSVQGGDYLQPSVNGPGRIVFMRDSLTELRGRCCAPPVPAKGFRTAGATQDVSYAVAYSRGDGAVSPLDPVPRAGAGANDGARPVGGALCPSVPVSLQEPAEPHLPHSRAGRPADAQEAVSVGPMPKKPSPSSSGISAGPLYCAAAALRAGSGGDAAGGSRAGRLRHHGRRVSGGTVH